MILRSSVGSRVVTLLFCCAACNPDKEVKLLAEIDAFGRDAVPTFDDLGKVGGRRKLPAPRGLYYTV